MIKSELQERVLKLTENALKRWSRSDQIGMTYEEICELGTAINQWRRGRIPAEEVLEEVADVYILLNQMIKILDATIEDFEEKLKEKLLKAEDKFKKPMFSLEEPK